MIPVYYLWVAAKLLKVTAYSHFKPARYECIFATALFIHQSLKLYEALFLAYYFLFTAGK